MNGRPYTLALLAAAAAQRQKASAEHTDPAWRAYLLASARAHIASARAQNLLALYATRWRAA